MTPRALALRLLRARFGRVSAAGGAPGLAGFQQEAHDRLLAAIARYGGALLADSVGLGKTFVAAAVARSLDRPGQATIAVVPTSLVRLWRNALRGVASATLVTHATLSRGGARQPVPGGLVIVDEAHAFRNPRTRRYAALSRLVEGRPLLLLTATPVNNSVWDLYWLLRLFAADDAFADRGVAHLFSCFDLAHRSGRAGRIPAVLAAVVVRRSRALVTELHGEVRVDGRALGFPRREPPRPVRYDPPAALQPLPDLIETLELAPWQVVGPGAGVWLIRLLLLKRLESSAAALRASLLGLRQTLRLFADALSRGLLLAPPERRRRPPDPAQLELDALVLKRLPPHLPADRLRQSVQHDLARLRTALSALDSALPEDPKLAALTGLLAGELRERPLLLFTEFRETAEHLWRSLRGALPCALIHGGGAWLGNTPASRRTVIERFAPLANGVPPPHRRERVRLLIATDVLAEGLNLQDAADVLSYDLPWNPVRLVQRLGRIDRLGSPHPAVRSWYFAPHRELERLLGLLGRIRAKLRAIRTTVGAEAPVLALPAAPRTLRALARGDPAPIRAAERLHDGMFEIEERLRAAFRHSQRTVPDPLAGLPLAHDRQPPARARPAPAGHGSEGPRHRFPAAHLSVPAAWRCGNGREPPHALVCFRQGSAQRSVFVGRHGCHEDDVAAGELLLHALGQTAPAAAGCRPRAELCEAGRRAARRARRWLDRLPPREPARGGARRLSRRLLRLLQEVPGGPAEEECRRAERLLRLLQAPLSAADEIALHALVPAGDTPLGALLQALEQQLPGPGRSHHAPAAPAPAAPGSAQLAAVFLLDTGG